MVDMMYKLLGCKYHNCQQPALLNNLNIFRSLVNLARYHRIANVITSANKIKSM